MSGYRYSDAALRHTGAEFDGLLHLCDNDAHDDDPTSDGARESRPAATVRLTWPDRRFTASYACDRCAAQCVEMYALDLEDGVRHPVLVEPVDGTP